MKYRWWSILGFWCIALGLFLVILGLAMILAPKAHADMCGPQPGLPGGSYPWVQSCNLWVPGVPGVKFPLPGQPGTAPYPVPWLGGGGGWLGPYPPGTSYNPLPYDPPRP